jgi:two-component system phosphate regulon sensor histidine kinase PhoR
MDREGTVVADSDREPGMLGRRIDRPELRRAKEEGEGVSLRWSEADEEEVLFYAVATRDESGPVQRYLRLALPIRLVDERLGPLLIVIGGGLLVSLGITLLVTMVLSRHLRRAIERIA